MKAAAILLGLFCSTTAQAQITEDGALHEAIGSPDNLHISGSFRPRIEVIDGQFRPDAAKSDQLLSLRTTLFGEYNVGPIRIGAEFHDARGYFQDRKSSADTGVVNALEFSQYDVRVDLDDALGEQSDTRITAGRMTMALGSARLVSRQGFRNSMNAYTGFRLERTAPGGRRFVAFWSMPNVRVPTDTSGIFANRPQWDRATTDLQLFGAFNAQPITDDLMLETYAYGLIERDGTGAGNSKRQLASPGVRLKRAPKDGGIDFEVEAMAQFGKATEGQAMAGMTRKIRAYGLHGDVGYRWAGGWKPRIAAVFDYYSGNRDDGKVGRFDFLYGGRRFEFGPTALFGPVSRSNLISPGIRIEAEPAKRLSLMSNIRLLTLASATDSFGLTGVRDPAGGSGRDAGAQVEAQLRFQLIPGIALLDIGYARLFKGSFLRQAPNAPDTGDTNYGYADITFTF